MPVVSVASVDDAPRAAALVKACLEERVVTAEGMRYAMAAADPADRMAHWKAEVAGELVGWAYGGLDAFAPGRSTGFCGIVVATGSRGRGLGTTLWGTVSDHLDAIGATRIVAPRPRRRTR